MTESKCDLDDTVKKEAICQRATLTESGSAKKLTEERGIPDRH